MPGRARESSRHHERPEALPLPEVRNLHLPVHRRHAGRLLLRRGMHLRPEVSVSSLVRLSGQVTSEVVPRALAADRKALVAFARRRVGANAEDVVQEAAVRALRHADQLVDPRAARAWLFSIVRALTAAPAGPAGEPLSEGLAAAPEPAPDACDCVMTQVRALPSQQAVLLQRAVVEGASVAHLARELGITPNAARARLHRARAALKARLARHCGTRSLRSCQGCGCDERGCGR